MNNPIRTINAGDTETTQLLVNVLTEVSRLLVPSIKTQGGQILEGRIEEQKEEFFRTKRLDLKFLNALYHSTPTFNERPNLENFDRNKLAKFFKEFCGIQLNITGSEPNTGYIERCNSGNQANAKIVEKAYHADKLTSPKIEELRALKKPYTSDQVFVFKTEYENVFLEVKFKANQYNPGKPSVESIVLDFTKAI